MKVLLRAPLLTNSGYGVHSRQIFEWLDKRNDIDLSVQCLPWGRCSWIIDPEYSKGIVKKIMQKTIDLNNKNNDIFDVSFQVQLPNEWDNSIARKNIGISAFVETDRCNPDWINHCNKMDKIIVPSTFTKNIVKRSGVLKTQIEVIPEWFNSNIINKSQCDKIVFNDERYNFDTEFNIMVFGLLTSLNVDDDRKNIVNCLKWILETFEGNEKVGIVLKTSMGKGSIADRNNCRTVLKEIVKRFRKSNFPKIHLIHGDLSPEEVAALYSTKKIKIFASATRGEGYGLPLIDAAAAGIPIVTTGWSGHFEFLDRNLIKSVEYKLEPIKTTRVDGEIFLQDFRWAEPNKDSFCNSLKDIYENYDKAKSNAKQLKQKINSNFHKSNIKKIYDKLLDGK
mgnify:CR=1 FL=1